MKTLFRLLSFLTVGMLALGNFSIGAQNVTRETVGTSKPAFVPGEVIVKMKPSRTLDAMARGMMGVQDESRRTSGGEFIFKIQGLGAMGAMAGASAAIQEQTKEAVRNFNERDDVEYAQLNYWKRKHKTPNDTRFSQQWHYFNNGTGPGESPGGINLPKAWDVTDGDPSIVVAVIDTGILPDHEDITGSPNIVPGFDMISDPFIANDGDGRDNDPTDPGDAVAANECGFPHDASSDSWHGTHVAGTVGVGNTDNTTGVAGTNWDTKVQSVRVLGKCGGTTADINDAVRWAAGLSVPGVPNNPTPARVINLSLGGQPGFPCSGDPATQSAINDAVAAGTVVVVSAGNDAVDAGTVSPASCENVITVAASGPQGHLVDWYSNFGETIEIMAPGGDGCAPGNTFTNPDGVWSTVNGNYGSYCGTSMAAPHVSGVAALYMAEDDEMQLPGQVLARLQHDAIPRNSTQCPNPCGAGLLVAIKDGVVIPPDETEIPVNPPLPPPTEGSISAPAEKDWFKFVVASPGEHRIETAGTTDVMMSLFGPGDKTTLIANDDDSGQGYNSRIITTLAQGTYFVQIKHYSPTGTGDYTVFVQAQ